MDVVNAERVIQGDGTPEPLWREWLAAARIPVQSIARCVPCGARLVVVAPHPDDEVLAAGGLLAAHAAQGGETLVVGVSDGEASHAGSARWNPMLLAEARRAERISGLHRLGIDRSCVLGLGLPDGAIAAHADTLSHALRRMLRPSDVVVTTWQRDGHPDHEATGSIAAQACRAAGCTLLEAPVWMWHWAAPGDPRVPWGSLVAVPLAPEAILRKHRAVGAHGSQLRERGVGQGPVLGAGILARVGRANEYFFA